MNEKILQQILLELKDVKSDLGEVKTELSDVKSDLGEVKTELSDVKSDLGSVKSQLNENTQLTKAIYDRQEETDAKLEALSIDVHKAYGKITNLEDKLAFNSYKAFQNEEAIFNLKREFGTGSNRLENKKKKKNKSHGFSESCFFMYNFLFGHLKTTNFKHKVKRNTS